MASDGQIVFEVTADGRHAIADIKEITRTIQQETGKWDTAAKQSSDNISNNFSGMLKKLVAGFSAVKIGKALLDIGQDALQAASDLQEVQNVVDVTFGENANQIEKWAKKAGAQFGLTETQAKKFSSTMGAMLKSSGLAGDKIVDVSTDLAGLAADMASFYNLDFEEAFSKIRSGISGQTMPLKELGIDMSVATLNAFALKQGLSKTFNEMDQGEQTMLRYQYLMQATADAQGDFSRTSDGYANSVRKLQTNFESLKTTIGTSFINVVADAVGWVNKLVEALSPDESKRTVLDDFADIDLKTNEKLEQIKETAEEARALVEQLDEIGGSKSDKAAEGVQKLVDGLSNINLKEGKTKAVESFISVLSANIGVIAQIQGTDAKGAQDWLEGIATSASALKENDVRGWEDLMNTIKEGLPGLENTDFGASFFQTLSEGFTSVDTAGIKEFISTLAKDIDTVAKLRGSDAKEAQEWLNGIAESAGKLTPDDAAGWANLLGELRTGLPDIDNTEYGAAFTSLADGLAKIQPKITTLEWLENNAGKTGKSVNEFSQALQDIKVDQEKTKVLGDFVTVLHDNISAVAAIRGEDAKGAQEWLEGISESAKTLAPDDAEAWNKLMTAIKEGLPGIENTDFGASFFAALSSGFNSIAGETSTLDWVMDNLGNKTNKTAEEQALWLETCKRLVKTIPGLSSIINVETGEVKGGTQAVKDYIDAWEQGQTKLAMMKALEEKKSALSSRFNDIPGLQLDMALAQRKVRQQAEAIRKLYKQYGIREDLMPIGTKASDSSYYRNLSSDAKNAIDEAVSEYDKLKKAEDEATQAYQRQADALKEAEIALKEYQETVDEMPGVIEDASDAQEDWLTKVGKTSEEIQTLVATAEAALEELNNYAQNTYDTTFASVSSTVKGFGEIKTPMMEAKEKVKDLTGQLNKLGERTKKNADEWDKLNAEINKTESSKISSQRIVKNLEQQAKYMDDYLKNLEKARKKGISDDVLASLSDGSEESYDILAELAKASPKEAEKINKNFQKVADGKKKLSSELTKQQLTVDDTYKSLVEKAKEAVQSLDLEKEATERTGKTVQGIAKGISSHVPEVQDAVDALVAQLDRLSGFGVSVNLGSFGTFGISLGGTNENGGRNSFAGGIDYVPHDMYARIHEGEGVLKAEENAIYQSLKNGAVAGLDLETLGGVMRDNVKAGGNVYLDGKAVGNVISDRQGRSYKSLQRSGWQA